MNGGKEFRRNNIFIESCKGEEVVESHDGLHLEGTVHIKKKIKTFCKTVISIFLYISRCLKIPGKDLVLQKSVDNTIDGGSN